MSYQVKRMVSMTLVFALVLANFFSLGVASVEANTNTITVSEAIANNSGTATVEGYIVGTTISGSNFQQQGPFTTPSNLAIADSANETDPSKIMPVQLVSGTQVRAALNLVDNPSNLGKKVTITGTLTAYFSVPGLKSPTSYEILGGGTDPEPDPVTTISIAEAKTSTASKVIVEGIVTADNSAIGGGKLSTFIQDETAGINVFAQSTAGFPDLKEGDLIRVTGGVTSYKGLTEIIPSSNGVEVISSNQAIPLAKSVTLADLQSAETAEEHEGQLVKVTGYVSNVPSTPAGGGYNVSFIDADFNSTTLRIMEGTNAIGQLESGKWYDITAIVSQYDAYQILPRKANDIQLSSEQPAAPSAAGEYSSTVASVVDGDTIHLTTPVLGTTKVRYLNIDTPETYHNVVTEEDASQKEHGEAAKAYLNTLLKSGDEVKVLVEEEATDSYGRLLAQVIRKSDDVNTNLEMVRSGYASTYFIWPIGDDQTYLDYQAAVKEAKDNGLGIWNPENPLAELPFEFRAREQGKGLLRYVGNYGTKTYVEPTEWEKVPVESRVFFASVQEAEENGYTPISTDIAAPVIKDLSDLTISWTDSYELNVEVTDELTGVKEVIVTLDGKKVDLPYMINPFQLAIGEHIISVEAIDNVGNKAVKEFTLEVTMEIAQLDELFTYGAESGKITSHGIVNSLMAKAKSIQEASNDKEAMNQLNALQNQVNALSGKKIDKDFAQLILDVIANLQSQPLKQAA